jgi:hypothetical protein
MRRGNVCVQVCTSVDRVIMLLLHKCSFGQPCSLDVHCQARCFLPSCLACTPPVQATHQGCAVLSACLLPIATSDQLRHAVMPAVSMPSHLSILPAAACLLACKACYTCTHLLACWSAQACACLLAGCTNEDAHVTTMLLLMSSPRALCSTAACMHASMCAASPALPHHCHHQHHCTTHVVGHTLHTCLPFPRLAMSSAVHLPASAAMPMLQCCAMHKPPTPQCHTPTHASVSCHATYQACCIACLPAWRGAMPMGYLACPCQPTMPANATTACIAAHTTPCQAMHATHPTKPGLRTPPSIPACMQVSLHCPACTCHHCPHY